MFGEVMKYIEANRDILYTQAAIEEWSDGKVARRLACSNIHGVQL
jgi:hypothetical protein